MATNTIAGVNLAQVAEESLDTLLEEFAPLQAITTDFSADIMTEGASVTTRYPTAVTAVDLSSGYTSQNTELTAKTITLDSFFGFVYGFKDAERSKSSISLNDLFIRPAAHAVGKKVLGDLLALVTDANVTNERVIAVGDFDADSVSLMAEDLDTLNVPQGGRSFLLKPTYFGSLTRDSAVQRALDYGSADAIREHRIPRLHGFNLHKYNAIPGNTINLVGLACGKQALLMAARGVDSEGAEKSGVEVENITIPELGLTVQFRRWYDANAGELKYSFGLLYGVALGIGTYAVKLVSA